MARRILIAWFAVNIPLGVLVWWLTVGHIQGPAIAEAWTELMGQARACLATPACRKHFY